MEICQLYKITFDSLENHHPISEELIITTTGNEKLSAHGVMCDWISENLKNIKLYLGYDNRIYPKYKIKKINVYNGK